MTPTTLLRRLSEALATTGASARIAVACGVDESTVRAWKRRKRLPKRDAVRQLLVKALAK